MQPYTAYLRERLLLPSDTIHAVGLAYHVCDVFVPELRGALAAASPSFQQQQQQGSGKRKAPQQQEQQGQQGAALPAAALHALLEPFSATLARAEDQAMITRVRCARACVCVRGGYVHVRVHVCTRTHVRA